ncbi:unnamed protein product [Lota lota]
MSLKLPRTWDFTTFKTETARIARSKSVMPGEGSSGVGSGSGPAAPQSPVPSDRPLKAGWLKRQQRSLVKNWQHRYFVLRGTTLTYHKDDRETTVQGVIQLRFSKVNELPSNSEEPGKYLFQIIPRSSKERERCPYVFMTSSQTDMEEWVRSLRRAIGTPTTGVFGKSLVDTVTYEKRFGPQLVPILVQKCVEFIREHGLSEEGIFRLPGQDNSVRQFRDAFDAGERPSFPSDTDVHTVASLLKLYLRELPEPVIPWSQYQEFLNCTYTVNPSTTGLGKLEKQIALIPRINYNLLGYICRFLFEVQLGSKVNKMSVENLATVMGINLLKPQIEDPITMMKATPQIQRLMTLMIRHHEELFPPAGDVPPSPPASKTKKKKSSAPRSFVGWEGAEMGEASLSESPEEEEDNDSVEDGGDCSPTEPFPSPLGPSPLDPSATSPRKRTQTLPSFQQTPLGAAKKGEAMNRWSRMQEVPEERMGTLSEDIFKILDLHRVALFGSKTEWEAGEEGGAVRRRGSGGSSSFSQTQSVPRASEDPPTAAEPQSLQALSSSKSQPESQQSLQQIIESLQQRIVELSSTVAELRCSLAEERRRVAALEACLRSDDRSQDHAHGSRAPPSDPNTKTPEGAQENKGYRDLEKEHSYPRHWPHTVQEYAAVQRGSMLVRRRGQHCLAAVAAALGFPGSILSMASDWVSKVGNRLTSKTLLLLVSVLLLRGAPCGRGNPIPQPLPRPRPPATAATGGLGPDGPPSEQGVQSLLENLKEQFLRTFNLSGSGGGGSRVEPPPEYMMELYNRFANDHSAMPTANIIRSFKNEAPAPEEAEASGVRRHPLLFNVSVPRHERVTAAELRLYALVQNDRRLYRGVDRRVTVYERGPPDEGAGGPPLTRGDSFEAPPGVRGRRPAPVELASRQVYGVDGGWEAFDLTAAVQRWRRSESGTTHRLEVHIANLAPEEGNGPEGAVSRSDLTPPPEGDMTIDTSPEEKHKPLLIVFSNDQSGDDRQDRHELNEMIDHETSDLVLQRDHPELGLGSPWGEGQREDGDDEPGEEDLIQTRSNRIYDTTSRIRRNAKGNYCRKRSLFVEFKDIGWDSWILAPTGYDAFECSGVCTYPLTKHVTPTKHAIVQTLININSPQKAAEACCVPTKLEPISLLYLDDTGVVTYKYKYEGMVVAECGCR